MYDLWSKAKLLTEKKPTESNKSLEARRALLEAKTVNSSNDSLFADEKKKANNNPTSLKKGVAPDRTKSRFILMAREGGQSAQRDEKFY